jgi:hypothetical protein
MVGHVRDLRDLRHGPQGRRLDPRSKPADGARECPAASGVRSGMADLSISRLRDDWLQQSIDRDETAFRRRRGAAEALDQLRSASEALVYRLDGDRVDLLLGRRLGGFTLTEPRDVAATQAFVNRFYSVYRVVFCPSPLPAGSVRVERVRAAPTTAVEVQQYVDDIPVSDARWTLLFDSAGHLTHVMGAPFDPARITVGRRPGIDGEEAVAVALDHESVMREDVEASAGLAIEGRANRLVWSVELKGRRNPLFFPVLGIDAHRRTVVARSEHCAHGTATIPVTRYSHPGGVMDSSGHTTTSSITVDTTGDSFSLQRLGSGRSRIWNAKPTGADPWPLFSQTSSFQAGYFTTMPGSTADDVFNEQQTYYWAQTLKTRVDEWGREPNHYGHYPVDSSRAVNVEIVVNGDASMEPYWKKGRHVQHGYFRLAPRAWFSGHPSAASEVPTVFFFNSPGNSGSPQFFGPEYSSSYSIIAHEVGHFISYQYGDWKGPADTTLGSSLGEGFSMVLPALLGKQVFGAALRYQESEYVTTGGDGQWSHFEYGTTPLKYSDMDATSPDYYKVAWPFVQAMWRLMNNVDVNGDPVWGSDAAAIDNTADLFMYGLHAFTADSTMTWDKLCLGLLAYCDARIDDGIEKDPLPDSWWAVGGVFSQHGLLTACVNSP